MKDLGSKESLKQLALSMVTAGVLNEVGNMQFGEGKTAFKLNDITVKNGFIANAGKNLVNGLARATINSALTGTDLETLLKTEAIASILNAASAQGAKWVGGQAMEGGFFINDAGKVNEFGRAFAHAVVGCMAGAAGPSASGSNTSTGSGCGAGALGAVVGEFSAQLYGAADPAKTIAFASMMSGIAAAAAGQGPEGIAIAAGTGANAAQNNFLSHQLQAKRELLRKKVDKGTASGNERTEFLMLERADQVSDELLVKWRANPHSLSTKETQALASYVGVYAKHEGEAKALQLLGPQALFTGAFSNYGFPYAGTKAAQDAYLAAHPLSWKELFLGAGSNYDNPNRKTYQDAISQSIVANQHQAQADLGNTILLGSSKTLMLAASAFELGKGGAALVDGEYVTGIMHAGLGLLGMTGAYALGRPLTSVGGRVSGVGVQGGVVTAEGTANAATVQGLKGQLASENLANIAAQDSRLAAAVNGSGKSNPNFSIGTGTATEANLLGQTWVGDGARLTGNQVTCPGCLVSADGTRIYRPPTTKPNTPSQFNPTGVQANFVTQQIDLISGRATIVSNGHLVVTP